MWFSPSTRETTNLFKEIVISHEIRRLRYDKDKTRSFCLLCNFSFSFLCKVHLPLHFLFPSICEVCKSLKTESKGKTGRKI